MNKTISYKKKSSMPTVGEFIEVLWFVYEALNGSNPRTVSRRAKVKSVLLGDGPDMVATGRIEYCELNDFDAEEYMVHFLAGRELRHMTQSNRKTAKCKRGKGPKSHERRSNPKLCWRPSMDGIYESITGSMTTQSEATRVGKRSISENPIVVREIVNDIKSDRMQPTLFCISNDVQRVRESHAQLADNLERMSARLTLLEKGNPDQEEIMPTVFVVLKEKMIQAIEKQPLFLPKKGIPKSITKVDAMRTGVIRMKSDCDLRHIYRRSPQNEVLFDSAYCHTQSPCTSSTNFTISFSNALALFECMGIDSVDDRLTLCRRRSNTKRGEALRLLGTYRYSPRVNDSPAEISVGGSLPKLLSGGHRAETTGLQIPTVRRESREWDLVDGRYSYPLTLVNASCTSRHMCLCIGVRCGYG